mgnify:CR=1 FL=1
MINKTTIFQFVKFGIVGVSNTAISLIVYYIIYWINPEWYMIGNIAGWVISVSNAFFWNNRYVFKSQSKGMRQLLKRIGKTYLSYGATFLMSTAFLYVEVDILHWSAVICPIINLVLTIPLNFLLNKFWTFH